MTAERSKVVLTPMPDMRCSHHWHVRELTHGHSPLGVVCVRCNQTQEWPDSASGQLCATDRKCWGID
jgi:hypothetical protein